MELWVRSQSRKSLIRVQGLTINEYKTDNEENDEVIIEDVDTYIILGKYPKERAIKVLNEVQTYLNLSKSLKFDIFEMPEK